MKRIEIVVPCYNEEPCVAPLYEEVEKTFAGIKDYDWSLLYVNDGSTDGTLKELEQLKSTKGDKVQYISFARNFGKESAIYAGLKNRRFLYCSIDTFWGTSVSFGSEARYAAPLSACPDMLWKITE